MIRYSSRLPEQTATNQLTRAMAAMRASGRAWLDLTVSNPTAVGIEYPADAIEALGDAAGLRYAPEPFGLHSARSAVAADYARRGIAIAPDRIVLTSSTSEAYGYLFKLLCDPGDEVLVPQPSYPLFELLTALDGVASRSYRLEYHGVWSIDRESVLASMSPRTRAILVVSPNNPTGSLLRAPDREWLRGVCAARGVAIIGDEVFADYLLCPRSDGCAVIDGSEPVLTCSLGGLSKSAGLPQVKLGWIAVGGPDDQVDSALKNLELIADTYLSVSTPVQLAAPRLIAAGATIRASIHERVRRNLAALQARAAAFPSLSLLLPEGGWSAVLRVPAVQTEEALALTLLTDAGVLVHPGYFFDFAGEAFIVISLLPSPETFDEALNRALPHAAAERGPA